MAFCFTLQIDFEMYISQNFDVVFKAGTMEGDNGDTIRQYFEIV